MKTLLSDRELENVNGGIQTDTRKDLYENIILGTVCPLGNNKTASKSGSGFIGLVPEELRLD